jgi:hypothetical protein
MSIATIAFASARISALDHLDEQSSPTKFKYYPLAINETLDHFGAVLHLESNAIDGWDFAGALEMKLTENEYQALKAGKEIPARINGATPLESVYKVLVFKRPAKK